MGTVYTIYEDESKDNSFVCEPIDTEWNLPLDNFTVEFWFWMNGFDVNNQSVIDCDAFYIRLGNTQMITSAQMQINIWTVGGSTINVTSPHLLSRRIHGLT